jgi:hypothetical protein
MSAITVDGMSDTSENDLTRATGQALPSDADWTSIQLAYEGSNETLPQMAARFGVTRSAISWRARHHGWVMRNRPAGISGLSLVGRMYRLIERQLVQMERAKGPMSEKDAAVLVRMATTVDRLMEVEANAPDKPSKVAAKETREMQEIRKTIARRLEQLGDF